MNTITLVKDYLNNCYIHEYNVVNGYEIILDYNTKKPFSGKINWYKNNIISSFYIDGKFIECFSQEEFEKNNEIKSIHLI